MVACGVDGDGSVGRLVGIDTDKDHRLASHSLRSGRECGGHPDLKSPCHRHASVEPHRAGAGRRRHAIGEPAREGAARSLRARADRHPGHYGCRPCVWSRFNKSGACRSLWRPHDSDHVQHAACCADPPSPPCGGDGFGSGHAPGCPCGCGALRDGDGAGHRRVPGHRGGIPRSAEVCHEVGAVRRAGVEGTGSYGASLSRCLLAQGVDVFDVNWMDRADRRRRGKSDPLDAQNAARAVLSGRASARAKAGDGPVQIARMYKLAKASAVKARTQAINQLKSVLDTADPGCLRSRPRGPGRGG
ncbi:transposase [Streptomyces sp. FXJ1.172]|uniref:IS110 family transposase n=1 Tax=Streptomyces sp. FXJ1.172 TaxID=710705 RepID=UPI001F3D9828|nr:transposase [Streptomyces sp. FXJ1.172]WEO93202.1 transposase [Streptomyces sp. FXJ1.172]